MIVYVDIVPVLRGYFFLIFDELINDKTINQLNQFTMPTGIREMLLLILGH